MKELLSKLTWVDYIALAALLRGLYVGYKSGIFQETLRIVAYVLTLVLTLQFQEVAGQYIALHSMLNEETSRMVAFVAVLVAVYLVLKLVRILMIRSLKLGEGGGGQKVLGALMGGARLLVLLSFFFMVVDSMPLKELKTDVHERSLTGPTISQAAPILYDFIQQSTSKLGFGKDA